MNGRVEQRVEIRATVTEPDGTVVDERVFSNVLTNDYLDEIAQHLRGGGVNLEISYLALGDDNTAPAATDSVLGSEVYRQQITEQTSDAARQTKTSTFIPAGSYTGTVEEIGWFIGAATGTTDSGTMMSRTLYSITLTSTQSLTIVRTDTIAEAA